MFRKIFAIAATAILLVFCQLAAAASIEVTAAQSSQVAPATVTLIVSAAPGSGPVTVTQVEYFRGKTSLGVALTAPFTLTVPDMPAGIYAITAKATTTDANNPVIQSAPFNLSIGTPAGAASANFIHTDQLNTPRAIANAAGALVWQWDSDPFGKDAANEQPTGQNAFTFDQRFPGQQIDRETGLHYNYFRNYDANSGRYVESDPIGLNGGINTYSYALGNPESYSDPLGLFVPPPSVITWTGTTATSAGATAGAAVAASAVVGVGIGFGFNATWSHFAGQTFGSSIYDWVHPQSDPELQREIEKTANQREAHRICDEPPPSNLNPCELARWNLTKMLRCKAARGNLSDKWFGGPDKAHQDHITNNIDQAIQRYRNAVDKLCNPICK